MSHIATFIDELYPFLPNGAWFVRVSATAPTISMVGIRGRNNERGDFLITTTPAVPEDTNPDTRPLYLPHFVNGGGYTTQFVVFAATAESAGTALFAATEYFNQEGKPIPLPMR